VAFAVATMLTVAGALSCSGCRPAADAVLSGSSTRILPLVFEPERVQLDRETEPANQSITVALTNPNRVAVKLVDARGTCACAVAERLSTTELQPGQCMSLSLELQFPPNGRKDSTLIVATEPPEASCQLPVSLRSPAPELPRVVLSPREMWLTESTIDPATCEAIAFITTEERAVDGVWLSSAESPGATAMKVSVERHKETPGSTRETIRRMYRLHATAPKSELQEGEFRIQLLRTLDASPVAEDGVDIRVCYRRPVAKVRIRPAVVVFRDDAERTRSVSVFAPEGSEVEVDPSGVPNLLTVEMDDDAPAAEGCIGSFTLRRIGDSPESSLVVVPVQIRMADQTMEVLPLKVRLL
jgi:hypothetical protein